MGGRKLIGTVKISVRSLLLHKLQSCLAVLGILIGVMSVIWLLAIGQGISDQAQQQIRDLGARNIIVRSTKPPLSATDSTSGSSYILEYGLKRDDFERIRVTVPGITKALPIREIQKEVRYLHRTLECRIVGCTPEYFEANRLRTDRGRPLEITDLDARANSVVLAYGTAKELFPYDDPVGHSIQIDDNYFKIVGTTHDRTPTAAVGGSLAAHDFNFDVYLPLTTLRSRIGDEILSVRAGSRQGESVELSQVTVTIESASNVMAAKDTIAALLELYHQKKDWAVVAPLELLEQARVMQFLFNIFLGLIALISLVVGSIGIMNIMLATVTERTREIGIRRALGAKQRDILQQFLVEAIVLTGLGAILGVCGGVACHPVVLLVRDMFAGLFPTQWERLPSIVTSLEPSTDAYYWSIPLAMAIAIAIGMVFGLLPAQRAARLDPVEALRAE